MSRSVRLLASAYDGGVFCLRLEQTDHGYQLHLESKNEECGPDPTWLTLDHLNRLLFCLGEGLDKPHGSLTTLDLASSNVKLEKRDQKDTTAGPVSAAIYGHDDHRALALSHFDGSGISTWTVRPDGSVEPLQQFTFTSSRPKEQRAPEPHQALFDPTEKYFLVPDRAADVVRQFRVDFETNKFTQLESLSVPDGAGPRHGIFWCPEDTNDCFFFLVSEHRNFVTSYKMTYTPDGSGMKWEVISSLSTFGELPTPKGARAAEIVITPDHKFLIVSNRDDMSFSGSANSDKCDSFATFRIEHNGALSFAKLLSAGGLHPRHISLNKTGDLIALALQESDKVLIKKRDIETGYYGETIAEFGGVGKPTCVLWDE